MMPNLSNAVRRFEDTIQFQIVSKTVDDFGIDETSAVKPPLFFEGQLQPLHPRELMVKPEGQRQYKWWTLFTDLKLENDWIVKDEGGITYRVMSVTDWRAADFRTYQLIEGMGV
jgi:hypothetical protein